jgi:hypothetical protein
MGLEKRKKELHMPLDGQDTGTFSADDDSSYI